MSLQGLKCSILRFFPSVRAIKGKDNVGTDFLSRHVSD